MFTLKAIYVTRYPGKNEHCLGLKDGKSLPEGRYIDERAWNPPCFLADERGDYRAKFPRRGNFVYPEEVTFWPSGPNLCELNFYDEGDDAAGGGAFFTEGVEVFVIGDGAYGFVVNMLLHGTGFDELTFIFCGQIKI